MNTKRDHHPISQFSGNVHKNHRKFHPQQFSVLDLSSNWGLKNSETFMYFVQLDITPKSWRTVMKYLHFGGVFLSWGLPKTGNTGMRWIRRHLDTALPAAADFGPAGLTPAERPSEKRWWFLQVHQASPRITKFLGDLQDPICGGR